MKKPDRDNNMQTLVEFVYKDEVVIHDLAIMTKIATSFL